MVQLDWHRIPVKFPRGGFTCTVEDAPAALATRFGGGKPLALVSVRLKDGERVKVEGFGIPFANYEQPEVAKWVNDNEPIVGGITLLDFLRRDEFHLLVSHRPVDIEKRWTEDAMPPPFSYPYGTEHDWDLDRYNELLQETESKEQFRPAYR